MAGILAPRKPTGGLLGAAPLPPPGLLGGGLPGDDLWRLQAYRQKMMADALGNTWPAQMAKSAWGAFTLPGDVYAGNVDPLSDEGVQRSADLAGFVTLGAGAIPAEANSARAGIKVYHASPHDFDRFELSDRTIGTGEGAQAYGHGLYFAENEGVAKGYKDNLSTYKLIQDFNEANPKSRPGQVAQWWTSGMELDRIDDALKILEPDSSQAMRDEWIRAGQKLHSELAAKGRVYEAELDASPDDFLDWDKPLGEQSVNVRDAVHELFRSGQIDGRDKRASRLYASEPDFPSHLDTMTGARINELIGALRSPGQAYSGNFPILKGGSKGAQSAAEYFRAAGIKGIRYKDAGSRTKEGGTSNYVVFDDNIINILRKYGIAGLIGGAAGAGAMAAQPGTAEARESR